MKRAAVLLSLLAPAFVNAQISTLRLDLQPDEQILEVFMRHRGTVLFGYPYNPHRNRPLSRPEMAAGIWQAVHVAQGRVTEDRTIEWAERQAWIDNFWMFNWLRLQLEPEMLLLDYRLEDYDARVESIKQNLAKRGITVEDPYARFADVPEDHWASDAIHNLRKLGILRGYPDNTFRG